MTHVMFSVITQQSEPRVLQRSTFR